MPSLLGRLGQIAGNVAIPAAAARGGYLAGEDEAQDKDRAEKRQSMLDKMQATLQGANIDEARARGRYYDTQATNDWGENSTGDIYNRRTGEVHRGSGHAPVPHGEEHYDPQRDEVGLTMLGPDGTPTWKKTRDATMIDRAEYKHKGEYRDPSAPAPEQPDVVAGRDHDLKRKKADDLVTSFLATHDLSDLTAENLQIHAGHPLTSEERAALGRVRIPPASDRSLDLPPVKSTTSPAITPPGGKKPPAKRQQTTSFEPASSFAKKARGENTDQDEIDKAALRQAHPDYTEAQVTDLLASLRSKPPIE